MDYRERYQDQAEATASMLDNHQAQMWTALPGIVSSFNPQELTVEVQPAVCVRYTGADQSQQWLNLPVLPDVPVVLPRGGKYTSTYPIQPGDECLVVFSSRNIDGWWSKGGAQPPTDLRMHDLSDGFAIVGPWSQAAPLTNYSNTTAQLRNTDGTIFAEIDDTNQVARLVAGGLTVTVDQKNDKIYASGTTNIYFTCGGTGTGGATMTINMDAASQTTTITSPTVVIDGTLYTTGDVIAGSGSGDPVDLQSHVHSDVQNGSGTSGAPVPGT